MFTTLRKSGWRESYAGWKGISLALITINATTRDESTMDITTGSTEGLYWDSFATVTQAILQLIAPPLSLSLVILGPMPKLTRRNPMVRLCPAHILQCRI